jgi:hypothetical protein
MLREAFLVTWNLSSELNLVAGRRDNVTADAAGPMGIFLPDRPELLHDLADPG